MAALSHGAFVASARPIKTVAAVAQLRGIETTHQPYADSGLQAPYADPPAALRLRIRKSFAKLCPENWLICWQ